jgi:hypothetical protein
MSNLELVRGRVTEMRISKGYEDPVFTLCDKDTAGVAAVAAAVSGEVFSSAFLANASQGASIDVEYFFCEVDGLSLSGHLYRVGFGDGDEMDFVVEKKAGRGIVHAARSPVHRLIWMLPYKTRGLAAQRKNNFKWRSISSFLCAAIPTAFLLVVFPTSEDRPILFFPMMFLGLFLTTLGISFLITRRFHEFSLQATEVLEVFGYDDPTSVDLPGLSKAAEKKWRLQAGGTTQHFQPWRFRY